MSAGRTASVPGVNLAGYFRTVFGVGEVARGLVDALESQGVPVAPVGVVAGDRDEQDTRLGDGAPARAVFPVNLICVNAQGLPVFADRMGPDFFEGRHSIGFWWWEVDEFPAQWLGAFDFVDEVWVGSAHVAAALSAVSPVPVVQVTIPVEVAPFESLSRERLGLPSDFVFLYAFDYNSGFERKNPLAVVRAFERAFEEGEGTSLVLKCIGHERAPEQHAELMAATAGRADVQVIDRALPREEKDALIGACDCFVSLHRAEGFGIALAEAMALGKPVIGTGYSGNLDFMTPQNSWLVDHTPVAVGEGAEPYPATATWAEPDLDHAAQLMRQVHDDPEGAAARAARGQKEVLRTHSRQAAGRTMARRLARIGERWGPARPLAAAGSTEAARRIQGGPLPHRQLSRPRAVLRGLALRAMRPYTVFQRGVDEELLHTLQALEGDLAALAAGQGQLRSEVARLVADSRATPETPIGVELAEHPVAGVVAGYSDGTGGAGRSAAKTPAGDGTYERLTAGAKPHLEVDGDDGPLRAAADGELGAVTVRGIVERLQREELGAFFELARSKLAPAGILIVETPNPHSPKALKAFWGDPSHSRPLFPEAGLELCRLAGFGSAFVFHPHGSGNVEGDRFDAERYALVACPSAGALDLHASAPRF